jgi:hypothetical protein
MRDPSEALAKNERVATGPGWAREKERTLVSATIDQRLPIGTVRNLISARMREVRMELFGVHGGPMLAQQMGLPARTWADYENGVTVPAEVMLVFLEITGCAPRWLLSGDGPRFADDSRDGDVWENKSRVEGLRGAGLLDTITLTESAEPQDKAAWEGSRRELKAEISRLRTHVTEAMKGGAPGTHRRF